MNMLFRHAGRFLPPLSKYENDVYVEPRLLPVLLQVLLYTNNTWYTCTAVLVHSSMSEYFVIWSIRPHAPPTPSTTTAAAAVASPWCTLLTLCYVIPARRNPRFQVTIDQVIGGARGIKSMVWETSNLDADEVRDKKALMTRNVIFCVHCCYTCLLPVRII